MSSVYGEDQGMSMCELFCRGLVYCLFGYQPVTNGDGVRRAGAECGITVQVVDEEGNERSIQTTLHSFLKHLQTLHAKEARTEGQWRRGNIAATSPRRLEVPDELWDRVRASKRDKCLWRRLHSAAEGYRRRQLALHEFLAVLDAMQDSEVAVDLLRCVPLTDFVEMARSRHICASDGCNALDWALCLGGRYLDFATVDAMLEAWPDMAQNTDKKGKTALHTAASTLARDPHAAILERVLQSHPKAVEKTCERGWLPLHCALLAAHPRGVETVTTLIKAYPEAVATKDRIGWTPFHMAIFGRASNSTAKNDQSEEKESDSPLVIFNAMLEHGGEYAQQSLKEKDQRGLTVYHVALCRISDDLRLVRRLLEVWPEGVQVCDHDGYTPLHSAVISTRANLECVKLIHQAWPEALDRRNAAAHTPLHAALQAGHAPMDVISYLLDASPTPMVYTSKGPGDESLLHAVVLNRQVNVEMVRRVYDGHPAAIRQRMGGSRRNGLQLLPLQAALVGGAPREVVEFLLEKWRGAVREGSVANVTALHWAVMARHRQPRTSSPQPVSQTNQDASDQDVESSVLDTVPLVGGQVADPENSEGNAVLRDSAGDGDGDWDEDDRASRPPSAAKVDIVKLIHRAWPEALEVRNQLSGGTPFMEALLSGAPADVIEYLLSESHQVLGALAIGGMTALHAAAIGGCSAEVFRLLLQRRRDAPPASTLWRKMPDSGATPLTLALTRRASPEVVQLLLRHFPDGARDKMKSGLGETPLHLAVKANCEPEVIQLLVDAWPEGRMERDREGSLPALYAELCPADKRPAVFAILALRRQSSSRGGGVMA